MRVTNRRFVLFYHSLVSDWNHGNAHFLRGVVRELRARGQDVAIFEPRHGWSRSNLLVEQGQSALDGFAAAFPGMTSVLYDPGTLDIDAALDGADVVIVHEWNDPALIRRIGQHRLRSGRYALLFHDTHHRAASAADQIARLGFDGYDGVLAFGEVVRQLYVRNGWSRRVWTWHEAADTALFRPSPDAPIEGDLVWVGNWGDNERTAELAEFLLQPVKALALKARVHGVRYPDDARRSLDEAGIELAGWLPNHRVPEVFARFRVTIHVPRRPYVAMLPGIPTIRVFEALACGIPLVSAPWQDSEGLFEPGKDFLFARSGTEMRRLLRAVLHDSAMASELRANGLRRIQDRHTCGHRVEELLHICTEIRADPGAPGTAAPEPARAF